ncbi:MAG: DUF3971 domain-containing protein, partial [Proteobacteria bacterium]|nr:DUF3971 domain-containing protein [Pseudomonadota bacterium]
MLIKHTFRMIFQMLGGLGAGVIIIALLIAWQLQRGPVSLDFLAPYVERALNQGHRGFRLAISETTLTWAGWDRAIDIRVKGVRAVGDGGQVIARIPELSLSLSGRAMLGGVLAPSYIEFLGPELRVRRMADGSLDINVAGVESRVNGDGVTEGLLGWLMHRPDPGSPMSYLATVRVSGATMTFDDRMTGKTWSAPVGYLSLDRAPHGLLAKGLIRIDVDGRSADVSLHGSYAADTERLDLTASFKDISPASFSAIYYKLGPLAALNLPLSGTVVVGAKRDGKIETIGFNVTGGGGDIELPPPFKQLMTVKSVVLRGLVNGVTDATTIDEFTLELKPGSSLVVPAPISHAFPLAKLTGSGRYIGTEGKIEISKMVADIEGPRAVVSGTIDGIGGSDGVVLNLNGELSNVPVDNVERYWPQALGSDAHRWATSRIKGGTIRTANAKFDVLIRPNGEILFRDVDGTMTVDGARVEYLAGMPAVVDAAALINFDEKTFDIAVSRGHSGAVNIVGGTIHIFGLHEVDQYADIDISFEAPFMDALKYLDNKPLGFTKAMGLKSDKIKGKANIDLHLRFLLAKYLKMSDVEVQAGATLKQVAIDDVVLGRGIQDGDLKLAVNKTRMDISGNVKMGDIPVQLSWQQNFRTDAAFRSLYTMSAKFADLAAVRDIGVDMEALVGDAVSGGLNA